MNNLRQFTSTMPSNGVGVGVRWTFVLAIVATLA